VYTKGRTLGIFCLDAQLDMMSLHPAGFVPEWPRYEAPSIHSLLLTSCGLEPAARLSGDANFGDKAMRTLPRYTERRSVQRLELMLSGHIHTRRGGSMPCIVKNISSRGALLTFDRPTIVPAFFTLSLPDLSFEAVCEKRHATEDQVGVKFTSNKRRAEELFASPFGVSKPGICRKNRRQPAVVPVLGDE